jgi:hypothetical protein
MLAAGAYLSTVPVVTAMAIVALGATGATVGRSRTSSAAITVIAGHLFVYVNLYLLFVGAVCHAAVQGPETGVSFLQALDMGVSVVPMALVVRKSLTAIGGRAPAH